MNPVFKWGCLAPLGAIILLTVAVIVLDEYWPSAARRALPRSATDVREYYVDWWIGDYIRCVRARIPEADVEVYAKNLGLATRFNPVKHASIASEINMHAGGGPNWWNPPDVSASSYFIYKPESEFLEVLSYADGYAYFISTSW